MEEKKVKPYKPVDGCLILFLFSSFLMLTALMITLLLCLMGVLK